MTRFAGKVSSFWHVIAFAVVGFSITVLVCLQLFVDQFQRPISRIEFLRPQTWKRIVKSFPQAQEVKTDEVFWWQEGALYQGLVKPKLIGEVELDPETPIFLSPQKDKLAWLAEPGKIVVFDLATGQISHTELLPNAERTQIIHWSYDNESLLVAQFKKNWSIIRVYPDRQDIVQTDISYNHPQLTMSFKPISQYLVYPECLDFCQFGILDVDKKTVTFVSAFRENDPNSQLKDVVMHFFDETEELIAYQREPGAEPLNFFVINFGKELIQTVKLKLPSGRELSFVGYYPQTKEMAFVSKKTDSGQELLLYSAIQPVLRLKGTFPQDQTLRVLPINNLYVLGGQELKSIFQSEFREVVSQKHPLSTL